MNGVGYIHRLNYLSCQSPVSLPCDSFGRLRHQFLSDQFNINCASFFFVVCAGASDWRRKKRLQFGFSLFNRNSVENRKNEPIEKNYNPRKKIGKLSREKNAMQSVRRLLFICLTFTSDWLLRRSMVSFDSEFIFSSVSFEWPPAMQYANDTDFCHFTKFHSINFQSIDFFFYLFVSLSLLQPATAQSQASMSWQFTKSLFFLKRKSSAVTKIKATNSWTHTHHTKQWFVSYCSIRNIN